MKRMLAIVALVGLGFGPLGCGGQTASTGSGASAEKGTETAAATEPTENGGSAASRTAVEIPAADATPDQVVNAFLEARRSGDPKTTAALLTSKARAATAKHKIDVNGEALPDLEFQVAKPKFLKNNPKVAHVDSLWSEVLPDGNKARYEVTWALRKEASGWRVAGFTAELTPGAEPQFLDFEDPEDMIRKQQEAVATAEQPAPEQVPTANEREEAKVPTRKGEAPKRR